MPFVGKFVGVVMVVGLVVLAMKCPVGMVLLNVITRYHMCMIELWKFAS